jgi:hypothetical protein
LLLLDICLILLSSLDFGSSLYKIKLAAVIKN